MPELFEQLSEESEPAVRVVLSHYFLVFAHPYFDGNGRMGHFMMNLMLASGGYPWTTIEVEQRALYFAALERAHIGKDVGPFAAFLGNLVGDTYNSEG